MKKAIIAFKLLAVLSILISIPLLYEGISGAIQNHHAEDSYILTEAIVSGYQEVQGKGSDRHRTYYSLTYAYTVEGEVYYIADDLMVHTLPPANYTREVRYDPMNPENALLVGKSGTSTSLLAGLMFLLIPAIMLFGWLIVTDRLHIRPENIFDVSIGLVMTVIGFGTIYGMTGTLSIITAFKEYNFIIIIPLLMIIAGIYQTIKSVIKRNSQS